MSWISIHSAEPITAYFGVLGWCSTLITPIIVLSLALDAGLTQNQTLFLAVLAAGVSMWIFNLIRRPTLFIILAIAALDLVPKAVIFSGFISEAFFITLSMLTLSTLLITSGLIHRILLWLLQLLHSYRFPYGFSFLLIGIILTPLLLSPSRRIEFVTPWLLEVLKSLPDHFRKTAVHRLAVIVFISTNLFSPVFLTAGIFNLVIYGLLPPAMQQQFQWLDWFIATSITGGTILIFSVMATLLVFRQHNFFPPIEEVSNQQRQILGSMHMQEWLAIVAIILLVIRIILPTFYPMHFPWIVLALVYILLLSNNVSSTKLPQEIDWSLLVFIGGAIGLAQALDFLDINPGLAANLVWIGDYMRTDFSLFVILLTFIILMMRFILPASLTIVTAAIVFIPMAISAGVHPWLVGLVIVLMGEHWFLPYQCSYYLRFKSMMQLQPFDEAIFLTFNAGVMLIKLGGIYASVPFWKYLGLL